MKVCTKCMVEKDLCEFNKNKYECKDCCKKYWQEYKDRNAERLKKNGDEYRANNRSLLAAKEKLRRIDNPDYAIDYREANKTKLSKYRKAYDKTEIAKANKARQHHNRRALGDLPKNAKADLQELYGAGCMNPDCKTPNEPLSIDHVLPVSKGGTNEWDNLQLLCISCNRSKGNRNSKDFRMVQETLDTHFK